MTEKQITVRMDADLINAIDRRSAEVGLSRNEWIERSTRWVIHTLPWRATGPVRRAVAAKAPREVAGTYSEDMGLDGPDGK